MTHRSFPAAVGVFTFVVCSIARGQPTVVDPDIDLASHVTGLSAPTGFRFLGNDPNDLFVIEKGTGRVRRVVNNVPTTVLDLAVNSNSERGLLGIELDPSFSTNGFVYLYHSTSSTGADTNVQANWTDNRLTRYTWNGTSLVSPATIGVFGTASDGQASGPNHDGGPIRLGPDGKLYGITGDLNRDRAEQNNQGAATSSALVGGVYRLNLDGTVPGDNPFVSNANTDFHRWYAYGVRNSFGLAFDPVTGNLWDTENGPASMDEVNLVAKGFNSGWNEIMGPDSLDPQGVGNLVSLPGSAYSDPEFSFNAIVAPTGIVFLAGSTLGPAYDDAVLVGSQQHGGELYLFRLNANRDGFVLSGSLADLVADGTERTQVQWGDNFNVVTEMLVGPDGALYVTSLGNGTIYRLVPEPGAAFAASLVAATGLLRRRHRS